MDFFSTRNGEVYCEDVALQRLGAEFGTPLYVYSQSTLLRHVRAVKDAFASFPTQICYAVKANGNHSLLKLLFREGVGADLVSLGEMLKAARAGCPYDRMVFSGVGKQDHEIKTAIESGIFSFNVESEAEFSKILALAEAAQKSASITLRFNPNIKAATNPKIATGLYETKFGLDEATAFRLANRLREQKWVKLLGLSCHIGSQIVDLAPLEQASQRMAQLYGELRGMGFNPEIIDLGGGLGVKYSNETPPDLPSYANGILKWMRDLPVTLVVEPGRVLVANAGILLTRVVATKQTAHKKFLIVDAGMNDLIRPAMYDAYHEVCAVRDTTGEMETYDVVGPVCETGDLFGTDRALAPMKPNDLVYLRTAGAYSSSMTSQYNARLRPAEVLVNGTKVTLIREREEYTDLWQREPDVVLD